MSAVPLSHMDLELEHLNRTQNVEKESAPRVRRDMIMDFFKYVLKFFIPGIIVDIMFG